MFRIPFPDDTISRIVLVNQGLFGYIQMIILFYVQRNISFLSDGITTDNPWDRNILMRLNIKCCTGIMVESPYN